MTSLALQQHPGPQPLTNSRLSCFRSCPRKHYLRYELGLRPEETPHNIRIGSAFHLALDAIAKGQELDGVLADELIDPYDLALVAAMVDGYQRRWEYEPLHVVASELPFRLPLRNPQTGAATPIWRRCGVIDRIVELPDSRLAILESKSTSFDFKPDAPYWQKVRMDQQISIYVMAARDLGYEIDTILYDVTRRPGLKPLKATPEEKRKYKANGELYAKQRDVDETPEQYAARVAADIEAKRDTSFARIEIARLESDLQECASEIWQQQKAIRTAQRAGHWYRNPGECFGFFECSYLPICTNNDLEHVTPSGYVRRELATPGASPARPVQASGHLQEAQS